MRVKDHETFVNKILSLVHPSKYSFPERYVTNRTKLKVRHNECGRSFLVTPNHLIYYLKQNGFFCTYCNCSAKEKCVHDFLEENGHSFEPQTKWEGLKDKGHLRFDFSVYVDNQRTELLCHIEVDGEQHYKAIDYWNGDEGLADQQRRDMLKEDFCLANGIPLIRLKYTLDAESIKRNLNEILSQLYEDPSSLPIITRIE